MSFILLGILNSQAAGGGATPAVEYIASYRVSTYNPSSGPTYIQFTNIPQTYKHLEIFGNMTTWANLDADTRIQFNTTGSQTWRANRDRASGIGYGNDSNTSQYLYFVATDDSQNRAGYVKSFVAGYTDALEKNAISQTVKSSSDTLVSVNGGGAQSYTTAVSSIYFINSYGFGYRSNVSLYGYLETPAA